MKNILILSTLLLLLVGCASENNVPPGKWTLFGGPKGKDENAGTPSLKQVIYSGKTEIPYRISCKKSDVIVQVQVDNETIPSFVAGQTLDVEGKLISVSLIVGSSKSISASGTYERIVKSKNRKDSN